MAEDVRAQEPSPEAPDEVEPAPPTVEPEVQPAHSGPVMPGSTPPDLAPANRLPMVEAPKDMATPDRAGVTSVDLVPADPAPAGAPSSLVGTPHAKLLGGAAYALGIALCVATYFWVLDVFNSPGDSLSIPDSIKASQAYTQWGTQHGFFLLALLVMTFAGWLIAGRGAQLFGAGCAARSDNTGKLGGLLVFCGGVVMVVEVFLATAHYFGTSPSQLPAAPPVPGPAPTVVSWFLSSVFRILELAVMALVGSIITGRGVTLFLASFSRREIRNG